MNKKLKLILCIILCICLVFLAGGFFFVREGKNVSQTSKQVLFVKEQEGKIYFSGFKNNNKKIIFNTQNGKIRKQKLKENECVSAEYLGDIGSYFVADGNKYIVCEDGLIKENLQSKEKTTILQVNNSNACGFNELVTKYKFRFFQFNNGMLYFYCDAQTKLNKYTNATENVIQFCAFNTQTNDLYTEICSSYSSYFAKENGVYYIFENKIKFFDGTISTEICSFNKPNGSYLAGFLINDNGAVLIWCGDGGKGGVTLELYDFNSVKTTTFIECNTMRSYAIDEQQNIYISCETNNIWQIKRVSADIKTQDELCNDALPKKYKDNTFSAVSNITVVDSTVYYIVSTDDPTDDSFAFCKIDKNGANKVLYKENKHITRYFFKPKIR